MMYRGASVMQGAFPGKIHGGELFIPLMNHRSALWVLGQRVVHFQCP